LLRLCQHSICRIGRSRRTGKHRYPADGASDPPDVAEIGAKLSNPVSDVWALFTEFDLFFSDGDVDLSDPEVGAKMIVQVNRQKKLRFRQGPISAIRSSWLD